MSQKPLRQRPSIITRRLARGRYLIIALISVVTVFLAWQAVQINFDFSVDGVYAEDDPEVEFYHRELVPVFGSSENSLIFLLSADPLLNSSALASLQKLTEVLSARDAFSSVHSLANTRVPVDSDQGIKLIELLKPGQLLQTKEELQALTKALDSNAKIASWLLSKDRNTTAIIAQLSDHYKKEPLRGLLVRDMHDFVRSWQADHPGTRLRLAGIPVFGESVSSLMRHDQLRFIPAVLVVMAILLAFAFRSWRGTLLPFVATGTATLWTLGLMHLRGHDINLANSAIIVLLLVIGVSDAVHLLSRFNEEIERQRRAGLTVGKLKTIAVVTDRLGIACLLTSLTSALGFASLIVAKLVIIRDFGLDAGLGVLLAYIITIGLIPALLGIMPLPKNARNKNAQSQHKADSKIQPNRLSTEAHHDVALGILARLAIRHPGLIVSLALLFTILGTVGATRLQSHDRILSELPATHPAIKTLHFAAKKLGGLVPFDLVIETPAGRADDPDVISGLARLRQTMQEQSLQTRCMSLLDILDGLDVAVRGPQRKPLPWTRDRIAQYLLLLDMSEGGSESMRPYLSPKKNMLRVACFADDRGTEEVLKLSHNLSSAAAQFLPTDSLLHVTGPLVITSRAMTLIVRDMVSSLGLAMIVILIVMGLLFRSAKVGLIALIPNAIPILMTLGAMGWLGVSLRPSTAVIFSMSLGLAVDNAIHFLSRYREELQRNKSLEDAIEAAVRGTGRPILYTTIMLSLGLGVLLLSDFVAMQQLAILGAVTFVSAMVVDLLLLPVLLLWTKIK